MKKKLRYFWDYYKWYVFIPLALIIAIILSIRTYIHAHRPTDLFVSLVNCSGEEEVNNFLFAYSDELLANGTIQNEIRVIGGYRQPEVMTEAMQMNSNYTTSILAYQEEVLDQRVEVAIASTWVIDEYAAADAYYDLSTILSEDQMNQWKDDFYYANNSEGKSFPAGVYLKGSLFTDAYAGNLPVYGIYSYVEDPKTAILFMEKCMSNK